MGESKGYTANNIDYDVTATYIDDSSAKFKVNGEISRLIAIRGIFTFEDGSKIQVLSFGKDTDGTNMVEFVFKGSSLALTTPAEPVPEPAVPADDSSVTPTVPVSPTQEIIIVREEVCNGCLLNGECIPMAALQNAGWQSEANCVKWVKLRSRAIVIHGSPSSILEFIIIYPAPCSFIFNSVP